MLKSHFIPTMEKLKKRTSKVVAEEDHLRMEGKSEGDEEDGTIRDEFAVLCRDLYALYPLLIRYVDNNRYITISNISHILNCQSCLLVTEIKHNAHILSIIVHKPHLLRLWGALKLFVLQGKMADMPRPRCRGALPNGWRGLYFLVQISCEYVPLPLNSAICCNLHPLLCYFHFSLHCRTSNERNRTSWWWMRSITCHSSPLTARAKWAWWVKERQNQRCCEAAIVSDLKSGILPYNCSFYVFFYHHFKILLQPFSARCNGH